MDRAKTNQLIILRENTSWAQFSSVHMPRLQELDVWASYEGDMDEDDDNCSQAVLQSIQQWHQFNQSIQQNIETEEPDIDVEEIQSVKNEPNNQDTDVMIIPPDFQNEAGSDNENEMAQQYPINLANKKKRNVQIERLNISPVSLNFF